jgi:hypothetical protein
VRHRGILDRLDRLVVLVSRINLRETTDPNVVRGWRHQLSNVALEVNEIRRMVDRDGNDHDPNEDDTLPGVKKLPP